MKKVKKEHYVPRSYLEFFSCNNKSKINVFDKEKRIVRPNQNIKDVACEKYFYDIDWNNASIKEKYESIDLNNFDEQLLEKLFSSRIEDTLSNDIKFLKENVEKNSYICKIKIYLFLLRKRKKLIEYIYIQYCRTWQYKENMLQTFQLLVDFIENIDNSGDQIKEIHEQSKKLVENENLQNDMLLLHAFKSSNLDYIIRKLKRYYFLLVYMPNENFITSDNPIVTSGHIKDKLVATDGLLCEGVEIVYPLTPHILLILYENNYHRTLKKYNNKVIVIDNNEIRDYYNSLQTIQSSQYLFSNNLDFSLSNKICQENEYVCHKNRKIIELNHKLKKR